MEESENRRSWFLVLAAWAASVYLIGYATDATLSVLDEISKLAFGASPLGVIRNVVAVAVLTATLPALLLTIFVPHLPRTVMLPPIAYLLWVSFGAPPLPAMQMNPAISLALSTAQLLLGAVAFVLIRRRTGEWLLSAARLPVIGRLWLRTLGALALTVFLGVVALAGLATAAVVLSLERVTGGYMQFTWTGIELRETTLQRGHTTVHLVATAHIAEPQFYRLLRDSIPDDALVFVEGITDRSGRLQGFSQRATARALGLSTQDVFNALLPPPEDEDEAGDAPEESAADAAEPRVVRADVDAEVFSEQAVRYLRDVDAITRSASANEALSRLAKMSRNYTKTDEQSVFEEIVGERNIHLLDAFDRQAGDYDTVVIPWGAMHMPGLEKGLAARSFRVVSTRDIPMARYRTILSKVLHPES